MGSRSGLAALPENHAFRSIVVGAGSAGIAVVGSLLENLGPAVPDAVVCWIDHGFQGGRINRMYRQVPSNTKTALFVRYAHATQPFRHIVAAAPAPNALTRLQVLPSNEICSLADGGDLLQMLSDGLRTDRRVKALRGTATSADWDPKAGSWTVRVAAPEPLHVTAPMLVFCTGSSPTTVPLPVSRSLLDLDTALQPSVLAKRLPRTATTVGVVGASHSAILVLMNLLRLWQTTHPGLAVCWFTRHARLKFAEDRGDWVLYDNTGLKGQAADFARAQLDGPALLSSDAGRLIRRIDCSAGPDAERAAMLANLPACDLVVQAVGYSPDPLPTMRHSVVFDHLTGGFTDADSKEPMPGLFGAGIAFPERVVDAEGNTEYAVGWVKFTKFLHRVVPDWLAATGGGNAEASACSLARVTHLHRPLYN